MSPLVRSSSKPTWQRVPERNVHYYRCPKHKNNYVLSFLFEFDREDDTYFFAYSFPYVSKNTDMQRYLYCNTNIYGSMCADIYGFATLFVWFGSKKPTVLIMRTTLSNNTAPANGSLDYYKSIWSKKETRVYNRWLVVVPFSLVILCIQPECILVKLRPNLSVRSAGAMYAYNPLDIIYLKGLVDLLVSDHPDAVTLRNNIVFKIIPMLNPDGQYFWLMHPLFFFFFSHRCINLTSHRCIFG